MKRSASILRILFGLLIFAAAGELCARIDDFIAYGAPLWGSYNTDRLYERDQIGQRGRPGARYKKWQLNSMGYRGPELRSGTIRIVCFGSSETFGLYEANDEEFPRQLERDLNARSGKEVFQVVNVAYPGETVATSILRVPEIVESIHPRFAFIYASPANYIWLPWIRPSMSGGSPEKRYDMFDLRVADRTRTALKSILPEHVQTWLRQRDVDSVAADYNVMDRVPDENVSRYRSDLATLVNSLRSRGVEPILVTHASPFGEHPAKPDYQLLTSWRKFYPMLANEGFIDMEQRMNDAMRSLAASEHIQLVDAAREIPPSRDNFADFCHFTTLGAGLMASRLADEFTARNDVRVPAKVGGPANSREAGITAAWHPMCQAVFRVTRRRSSSL
jgi:lysophospholipase L1-like esterase